MLRKSVKRWAIAGVTLLVVASGFVGFLWYGARERRAARELWFKRSSSAVFDPARIRDVPDAGPRATKCFDEDGGWRCY